MGQRGRGASTAGAANAAIHRLLTNKVRWLGTAKSPNTAATSVTIQSQGLWNEQKRRVDEYRPDRRLFQSGHNDERNGRGVEVAFKWVYYYSAQVKSRALTILPLVCWMCGETNTLPIPPEKLQEFQCFHPVCHVCKAGVGERTRVKRKLKRKRSRVEEDGLLTF
ncbi:hypothetical protein Bbelb_316270, partial [Branchiostoma belcheri]